MKDTRYSASCIHSTFSVIVQREKKRPVVGKEYFNFMNLEEIVATFSRKNLSKEDSIKGLHLIWILIRNYMDLSSNITFCVSFTFDYCRETVSSYGFFKGTSWVWSCKTVVSKTGSFIFFHSSNLSFSFLMYWVTDYYFSWLISHAGFETPISNRRAIHKPL